MNANTLMVRKLFRLVQDEILVRATLAPNLGAVLASPLVEREGACFLRVLLDHSHPARWTPALFHDLTGWECFVNHIHIEDYLPTSDQEVLEPNFLILQGLKYAVALKEKLEMYSSETPFTIIVSFSGQTCTVRFHKTRTGEAVLSDDLEQYVQEGICILATHQAASQSSR